MGQSASVGRDADGNDIASSYKNKKLNDLTDVELKALWRDAPLTSDEIRQAARQHCWQEEDLLRASSSEFYTSMAPMDDDKKSESSLEEKHNALLASNLLRQLPELAVIRFKLVPARLKEGVFWEVTFYLLDERLGNIVESAQSQEELTAVQGGDDDNVPQQERPPEEEEEEKKDCHQTEMDPLDAAKQMIRKKDQQIVSLQREVEKLQAALQKAELSAEPQRQTTTTTTTTTTGHKGTWNLSQDSKDFLNYPEEIKVNLRREKTKRLQAVRDEMKFILDSDDVKDSNGSWACCGKTAYTAKCTK